MWSVGVTGDGTMMEAERIVRAMVEFDAGLPQDIRERIIENESDYINYAAVMNKLDELYLAAVGHRDEDVKELKVEVIRALDWFEYKYDVDMRAVQKMIL